MFFGIYLLIKFLEKLNIYIYLCRCGAEEIIPTVLMICIAFLTSAVAVLLYKNVKHKDTVIVLTVAFYFIIFPLLIGLAVISENGKYFEYSSDDKKHDIVVNECSFLLAGGGAVYEKTSFCTMRRVGGYTTDDGFLPFTNNAFYFIWNENDFELHHAVYGISDKEYETVKMKYVK